MLSRSELTIKNINKISNMAADNSGGSSTFRGPFKFEETSHNQHAARVTKNIFSGRSL